MPTLSRRTVLLGGAGVAVACVAGGGYELIQNGTLPGKYALARLTGACGSPPPPPPDRLLPVRTQKRFNSTFRRREVEMVTLVPRDHVARKLNVVIALHGSGSNAAQLADQVEPAMAVAHVTSFAVICVDGGDTYWHKRADGDDPVAMIVHEVLPRAAAAGMRIHRIGITGESMGGYGALLLAERLGAARTAAAAALSPAIFASYADAHAANRTAFDSAADFAANDIFTDIGALRRVPVWIACGSDDPFQAQASLFAARLTAQGGHKPAGEILVGCHDDAFWERNFPAALRFIAGQLS